MESKIENTISSLAIHAGLSEIQSQQLLQMAGRTDLSDEDKEIFKAMGRIDADTAAALRKVTEMLRKLKE